MTQIAATASQPSARSALAGLSLAMLMPALATSSANVALPSLALTFGATFQAAQWIVLSYLLTVTALIVVAGRLADILGWRRVLLAGMVVFALGSLGSGVAPSLELLIVARVAQGAGAAAMMALTLAFVGDVVPKSKSGSAMGLLGTMSAVGTTMGPAVGGVLIGWAGGRAIFLVNVPLAVLAWLIALRTLPADPPRIAGTLKSFDSVGTGLFGLTLTSFALAMTMGRGVFGPSNVALLATAFAASAIFVAVEAKAPMPLIRLSVFRNPALLANLASGAAVSTVMMATLIVSPFYLTTGLRLSPAPAGLMLAAGPFVAAVAGIPAGRLVDRFGTDRATIAGLALIAAGAASLTVLSPTSGVVGYIASIVAMTSGYGLFQAANNTATITMAPPAERGTVSGMLNLSRNLGLVTGASAMGAVFAWGRGATQASSVEPHATVSGMNATFAVALVLIVASLVIAVRASRGDQSKAPLAVT